MHNRIRTMKIGVLKIDENNSQHKMSEIEQFLRDVRAHFIASLETSEYENSSNLFHLTEAETTAKLLERCEHLLQKCESKQNTQDQSQKILMQDYENNPDILINGVKEQKSDLNGSYMDMTNNSKKKSASHEYIPTGSEKTYRSSTSLAEFHDGKVFAYAHEKFNSDEDSKIYDTCLVSQYNLDVLETVTSFDDCPFMNLPAGHLALHRSTKYGQLQKIEKRLFFDQFKKCYCGILNNWFLCYTDQTALSPTYFLFLKVPDLQIEHYGEGKRRDICFQLTTGDPSNEKLIFQANSEVDAKEWIHAIEAVRRDLKKHRRLPTPPVIKKIAFVNASDNNANNMKSLTSTQPATSQDQIDRIYEEPSPFYDNVAQQLLQQKALAESFEHLVLDEFYDIPKSPPKPVESKNSQQQKESEMKLMENELNIYRNDNATIETAELLNTSPVVSKKISAHSPTNSHKIRKNVIGLADKIDFQNKVKDLHSKLGGQLLSPSQAQDHQSPPKSVESKNSQQQDESEMKLMENEINIYRNANATTETAELLNTSPLVSKKISANSPTNSHKIRKNLIGLTDKIDFQNKVKDLHSKLAGQLLSPSTAQDHLQKKSLRKTYSDGQNDAAESMALTTPTKTKEHVKAQKSTSDVNTAVASCNGEQNSRNEKQSDNSTEKSPQRSWLFTRFQKSTSSVRCDSNSTMPTFAKCRQSEKENLLSDLVDANEQNDVNSVNGNKSKVHMIINRLEACGGHKAMFGMDAIGSLSHNIGDNSDCSNTYEPMMTVSTTPNRFLKKI